jgi:hypothetical protein
MALHSQISIIPTQAPTLHLPLVGQYSGDVMLPGPDVCCLPLFLIEEG